MITFVEGILEEKQPTRAVINAGGVGYELHIPLSSYDRLPREGERCRLLAHEHVREDAHLLFGFFSAAAVVEGDLKRLSSISGIGKKTAERIVVELRHKLSAGEALEAVSGAEAATPADHRRRDAVLALVSLGYKQVEAVAMVNAIAPAELAKLTVEDVVRRALSPR